MGIVECIPYRGSVVKGINYKDLIDSYEIRSTFERMVIKSDLKSIDDEIINNIHDNLTTMLEAAKNNDLNAYASEDAMFHKHIMEMSENKMLIRLWDQCDVREWTKIGTIYSDKDLTTLAKRHGAIYEGLVSGDKKAALAASKEHWEFLIHHIKKTSKQKYRTKG
jgi:DNA-binding GntR family transcriptional regulator